jgi:hypothetical protein
LEESLDCEYVEGTDCDRSDEECSDDCDKCNRPKPYRSDVSCPNVGEDFFCVSFDTEETRETTVTCKTQTCEWVPPAGEGEGHPEYTYGDSFDQPGPDIAQCNCQCHPSDKMINEVYDNLKVVNSSIASRIDDIKNQIDALEKRAQALEEAKNKLKEINQTITQNKPTYYDISSQIDYSQVKYWEGITKTKCYKNPTWEERNNGTCGDKEQSTTMYGAQITAAVVCCGFFEPCCATIKYSTEWFPSIYQVEGEYTISETIIDDKNRIMLHNIFAGEQDLYGLNVTPKLFQHVAPEFTIYKEHKIKVAPTTLGRVIVYLYLPKMAQTQNPTQKPLDKIISSFTDPTCTGKNC